MFGAFRETKIRATCLADSLYPIKEHANIDINRLSRGENFGLQEAAYRLLTNALGFQKKYDTHEMIWSTWLSLIRIAETDNSHSLFGSKERLTQGLRNYNESIWYTELSDYLHGSFLKLLKFHIEVRSDNPMR